MSDFEPTAWVDNSEPDVTASQLNRIEAGIVLAHSKADSLLAQAAAALAVANDILAQLAVHIARLDNPHQVTEAQVGVAQLRSQLAAHLADFNNPHKVTVDQAKAAS